MKFGRKIGNLWLLDSGSDEDAAKTVTDEANLANVDVTALDIVHNLAHKLLGHVFKAEECVHLVYFRHEEL